MHTACGFLFIWLSIIIARLNCKHPSECGSGWYILVVVERGWGVRAGVAAAKCGSMRFWSARPAAPLHGIRLWCGGLIILDILLYTVLWTCDLSLTGGGNYQVGESKATLYFPYIYLHTFFMLVKGNASSAEQGNAIFSTYIYTQICTLYTIIVCFFALLFLPAEYTWHTDGSIPLAISCDRLYRKQTQASLVHKSEKHNHGGSSVSWLV